MLQVGDVVKAGRASGINGQDEIGVVVDLYNIDNCDGWMIQFEHGGYDGFSPEDLEAFHVTYLRHEPSLSSYAFKNVIKLQDDYDSGLFTQAWRKNG